MKRKGRKKTTNNDSSSYSMVMGTRGLGQIVPPNRKENGKKTKKKKKKLDGSATGDK